MSRRLWPTGLERQRLFRMIYRSIRERRAPRPLSRRWKANVRLHFWWVLVEAILAEPLIFLSGGVATLFWIISLTLHWVLKA